MVFLIPLLLVIIPDLETFLYPLNFQQIYAGLLLILPGRYIGLVAVSQIRKQSHNEDAPNQLQTTGIYRKSRNPIVIGMHMTIVGLFLIFPSVLLFFGILFYLSYMHFKIQLEEEFLLNTFGKSYQAYCQKVNRYI